MLEGVREFNLGLTRFATELVPEDFSKLVRSAALGILSGVTLRMRVDTGRARGATLVGVGQIPIGEPGGVDPSGGATIARGSQAVSRFALGVPFVSVVNNVPYIEKLEDLDSMFALSVAETEARLNAAEAVSVRRV